MTNILIVIIVIQAMIFFHLFLKFEKRKNELKFVSMTLQSLKEAFDDWVIVMNEQTNLRSYEEDALKRQIIWNILF